MSEKHPAAAQIPSFWTAEVLRAALDTARRHANGFARQKGLSRADREDLTQDILLAIVEASRHFDPARGGWSAFAGTLAHRVLVDRCRSPKSPILVSLDAPGIEALVARLVAPRADADAAIGFAAAADDLPPGPRDLLRDIIAHADVPAARDGRAASAASFYRELADLRLWLRALGLRPAAPQRRRRGAEKNFAQIRK
jgi:hypothetical protein